METEKKRNYSKNMKIECAYCHNEFSLTEFYLSHSPMFSITKRMPVCKTCLNESCIDKKGNIDYQALDAMLLRVDRPFIAKVLTAAIEECESFPKQDKHSHSLRILGTYWRTLQSLPQYKFKTYKDSQNQDGTPKFPPDSIVSIEQPKVSSNTVSPTNTPVVTIYSKKWRGLYTQDDLDALDEYYAGLERDYKIITENHKDYAKKIAKASLMMDKAYEDVLAGVPKAEEKYDKLKGVFDSLCKSAKFSEDKRSINDVGISSFSIITARVAEHNWIPEHTPLEKDDIDKLLDYLSTVTKSL